MRSTNAIHTLFIPTPQVVATPVEQSPNQASLPLGAQREAEQTVPASGAKRLPWEILIVVEKVRGQDESSPPQGGL